jgi:hypothetical protein
MASATFSWTYTQPGGVMRLESYIMEGKEGTYNLKDLYQKLNKMYFGGSMPKIKVIWSGKMKRVVGKASVKYANPTLKSELGFSRFATMLPEIPVANVELNMSTLAIGISKMFDLSVADIKAVMLHEMVHIKLYTQRKVAHHHGTPEFDGWINKLRSQSGLDVPFKESGFKRSSKIKGKEGFVIVVHTVDGKKGIATYTTQFMQKSWLIFAETITRIVGRSSKVSLIEYFKINHPIIVEYPAKRSLRKISWAYVDDDTVLIIQKKGKKFGWSDKGGASIAPHMVGIREKSMHPIPVLLDKDGKPTNLKEVLK